MNNQYRNTSYMPPPTLNGVPIGDKPALQQYIFIKDYIAERPKPLEGQAQSMEYVAPKKYLKGEIVTGYRAGNNRIFSEKRDITEGVKPYAPGMPENKPENTGLKQWITPTNILLGSVILVGLAILFKRS